MAGPQLRRQDFRLHDYCSHEQHSGFLQREVLSGLVPSNLNNDVHPVFDRTRFSMAFDYDKLKPTLMLASHFLETALPIFHSILCGRLSRIGQVGKAKTDCYSFPDPLTNLTDCQKTATYRRIEAFSIPLRFYLETTGNATWHGLPAPDKNSCDTLSTGLAGCAPKIWISGSNLYDPLVEALAAEDDIVQQQYWSFKLAITLVHELSHAAVFAATTDAIDKYEYFLGDHGKSTEMGFETEAWLFGGVTPNHSVETDCGTYQCAETGKISEFNYMITAHEYHCPLKAKSYQQSSVPYLLREKDGKKTAATFWNTSFLHIHQMFQDAFWKDVVPFQGRKALFFERHTSLQYGRDAQNEVASLWSHAVDSIAIPHGYYADRRGLIRWKVGETNEVDLSNLSIRGEKMFAAEMGNAKRKPTEDLATKTGEVWRTLLTKVREKFFDHG
ncbi:hypothetical protein M409DRAFT_23678 [Zasmidium cellare ATCC 36951]|uniref:Uncharacterized protein n=1 Tax=Zasmidium cellare ATCC 36951 TaxID=1080233 RepID=A0A6A6CID7_ZASCE|nr:uncharacterized protein M409DRAFT_23678 [Zasmidium cellare ATCC 36951]KAF2165948.1 hypothetical protein M409DRAFT_23678 [Zasmidium cellare ATCC 36951]